MMTPIEWATLAVIVMALLFLSPEISEAWTTFVFWAFDQYFFWREARLFPETSEVSEDDSESESGPTFLE